MIKVEKELYDFKLINLYWSGEKLEKDINTKGKFAQYCIENNISSLSMSTTNYSEELVRYMKEQGLIVYIFTENDEDSANKMIEVGTDIIGTDFLV